MKRQAALALRWLWKRHPVGGFKAPRTLRPHFMVGIPEQEPVTSNLRVRVVTPCQKPTSVFRRCRNVLPHFLALLSVSFPAYSQQGLVPQEPPHTIERFQDMPIAPSEAALMAGLLLRYRGGIMTLSQPLPDVLEACDRYWGCIEWLDDGTCFIRAELVANPEWLPMAGVAMDAFLAECGGARLERRGSVAAR